jgi:hypothetical protein
MKEWPARNRRASPLSKEDVTLFGGLFGGGKKKPAFKLQPRQEVEVEFENADGNFESHFVQVQDVQRKKAILHSPGTDRRPIRLYPDQAVTLTIQLDDVLLSYEGSVLDVRDREFDVNYPPKDYQDIPIPPRDEKFRIEVPIPVEYRAMTTAHLQVATTHAVTMNGLFLMTNLPIPRSTSLLLELEIPNAPDITAKGRAITSQEDHSTGRKRHITEVEYEDLNEKDKITILRYAVFYRQRQARTEKRLAETSK